MLVLENKWLRIKKGDFIITRTDILTEKYIQPTQQFSTATTAKTPYYLYRYLVLLFLRYRRTLLGVCTAHQPIQKGDEASEQIGTNLSQVSY